MTRVCTRCNTRHPIESFSFKNKSGGVRQEICKTCRNAEAKEYHKTISTKKSKYAQERRKRVRAENANKILDYLEDKACEVCGEKNALVLDFHHKDNIKTDRVSNLLFSRLYKFDSDKVQNEIKRCEVMCSNCHRIETAKELGFIKYKIYQERLERKGYEQ